MAENKKQETPETASPSLALKSTQSFSPVLDIQDGIIITKDGRYVQILEFDPVNFLLFPEEEQDAIADTFGYSLAAFPTRFQIKVLSRKANVDSHIGDYLAAMQVETNAQTQKMQQQSIEKIQKSAANSISRRFFIAHSYEQISGIRHPEWNEIRSEMYRRSSLIAGHLAKAPCLNTLTSPIGDTDAQLEALYLSMARGDAAHLSFEARVNEVVARYIKAGKLQTEEENFSINDLICPEQIEPFYPNCVVVDGKYMGFACIEGSSYPLHCYSGWLQQLVDLGEDIDIDIFCEKRSAEKTARDVMYATQLARVSLNERNESAADLDLLTQKVESGNYIRAGLSAQHALMDFSIMLTIVADDMKALRWRMRNLRELLMPSGLRLNPLNHRHLDAFRASLPLCSHDLGFMRQAKRNILNPDLGAAYPFLSYEINDAGGFMLGKNLINQSPIFLNLFNRQIYSDGNVVILGPPGSGKTYCLQTVALALRQLGVQVIINVPYKGYEYRAACEAIGGQFITLAPGSPHNINIMEIRKYDTTVKEALEGGKDGQTSRLTAKINTIRAWISLLFKDDKITMEELADLDEACRRTYKRFGITEHNQSLIDPDHPNQFKKMPVLGDLYEMLGQADFKHSRRLRSALERFVIGASKSFNGPTNVNLDNPYVVIDTSEAPKELISAVTFIANDFATDCIRRDNTKRKAIINDEISRMIGIAGTAHAAEVILQNCKLVRGYNGIVINATQDTNDFFALENGVYGKGIFANSKIKLILRQEPQEARTVQEVLNLSDEETSRLPYYEPGCGLLVANRNHAEVRIIASPIEDELINSDPEHIRQRLQRKGVIT